MHIGSRLIRILEREDLSFPKKHTLPEVRCDEILMRTCIVRCSYCDKFVTARLEVLPKFRHGGVFQVSTMVNLGIGLTRR